MAALFDSFNKSQTSVTVNLVGQAEADYNSTVKAAAASGGLPDLLDFDGPALYNYSWSGDLIPLESCLSSELRADLLPSLTEQGTYASQLYGVGYYQGSHGIFARRSILKENGIRIPTGPKDAWTAVEFTTALETLKKAGFAHPLDLKMNYGVGEWFTFGFSPVIQSAGADLIDRTSYQSATGALNSDAAVAALSTVQSWFSAGYVDPNDDDAAFIGNRSPISWVGPWVYPAYSEAVGDDLIVVPLPDFGGGTKSGNGAWQWGISKQSEEPDAVAAVIEYMLSPDRALQWPDAVGQGSPIASIADQSKLYGPEGPLNLITQLLDGGYTVTRPQTPAYPTITSQFARAFKAITDGADVKESLDAAAAAIDQDIQDNEGYPVPEN
jgi:multiple sugar transport system substrate-binding protein